MVSENQLKSSADVLGAEAGSRGIEKYLTFLERLPQPAMFADRDGTIVAMNREGLTLLEADTAAQVLGRRVISLLVPEAQGAASESYIQSVKGSGAHSYYELVTRKGNRRTIEVVSMPFVVSAAGEVELMLGLARDATEQRRAEQAQNLLAAIVESCDDAIVSYSPDLRITTWNHGAEKLLGFTAAEAIGQSASMYIPPEMQSRGESFLRDLQSKLDRINSFEVPCLRKDGSQVDVWTVCFGIRDCSGKLLGMSTIHRDITERKRAERERALLASIVESSEDAIISLSPELRIMSWNRGAQKLLGFTAQEAVGQSPNIFIPPRAREQARSQMRDDLEILLKSPAALRRQEVACLRKDGSLVDTSMVVSGIYDASGKLVGMAPIFRNITERRRAERERALLASIVESSEDAIVSLSLDFRITSWNRGAERVLGFSAQDAIGQHFTIYVPPELRAYAEEDLAAQMAAAQGRKELKRVESELQRKDGHRIDCAIVTSGIYAPGGNLIGLSGIISDVTERKRAWREQALLAAIVESTEDAIITKAPDYTIQTWNGGAERLYGYTAAEIIGKPITKLIPAERRDELEKVVGRALKGERIQQYETKRLHKDGRLLDVSLSEAPVHDTRGTIVGVAAIERNISERLRTRMLESQMAAIVKSTTDAVYSVGPGHVVTSWNPGAERLFGYRAEEVIGKRSPTMVPEVQDQLDEMLRRVLDSGETVEFESKRRRKDGAVLDVSVTASPIYDNTGMVTGLAVITRNITERKRAERALVAAQQELRSRMRQQAVVVRLGQCALGKIEPPDFMAEAAQLIAETLAADTCAIAELQPDGKTLVLRAAIGCAQGMLGAAIDSDQDSQAAYALHGGEPAVVRDFASETRFQRSAFLGSLDAVSGLSVLVPESERPHGVIAVGARSARDFSRDNINFVQAIAYILAQVMERRRTEHELKAARDEALESARAKSAFLANMSHEIRTPLNSIVGLSGLLLDTPLNHEQRDYAETIRVSSDVLLDTINNVLDFTRISTGKPALENVEFDARTVTQTAVELVAETARKKQLELLLFVNDQVPRVVRGDPARLRQVLVNLLANAVKFTEIGEVVVRVTMEREAEKNAVVRFEVSDTGVGIPEQAQRRLFAPFYQADSSTTRRFGGSGLGLAISAQLVELMGGRIGLTSQPGEGSTFWFTVSLEKSALSALSAPADSLANLHVLIVDDNATSRQIVRQHTQSWGARPDCAAGAAEALSMMRKEADTDPYAVAVVDFQMPETDGLELAERIKADPMLSKIQVVMMSSGGGRKEDDARAAALDAWLSKPINAPELFRCLTGLERVREQAPSAAANIASRAPVVQAADKVTTASPADARRILLAEDNPVNQKVAQIQLKKLGYQVDVAGNGREALQALERGRYDAVLMDCQMPEMDGYEAIGEIRKREAGSPRHTIVIAMTAFGLSGDREKCLSAGMDDYVPKPVRFEQLKEVLERWAPSQKTVDPAKGANMAAPLDRPPNR